MSPASKYYWYILSQINFEMYILGSTKILYSYIPSTYYLYVFVLTRTCTSTYSVCTGTNIFEGFRPGRGVRLPDVVQQGSESQPTAGDGEEAHEEEAPADPGPAGAQADAAAAAEPAATAAEPAATGAKPPATGKPAAGWARPPRPGLPGPRRFRLSPPWQDGGPPAAPAPPPRSRSPSPSPS